MRIYALSNSCRRRCTLPLRSMMDRWRNYLHQFGANCSANLF